jgi:hypothetical protein
MQTIQGATPVTAATLELGFIDSVPLKVDPLSLACQYADELDCGPDCLIAIASLSGTITRWRHQAWVYFIARSSWAAAFPPGRRVDLRRQRPAKEPQPSDALFPIRDQDTLALGKQASVPPPRRKLVPDLRDR